MINSGSLRHGFTQLKRAYKTLGLPPQAQPKDIKSAYYRLAKQYHPDQNSNPTTSETFNTIQSAYQLLITNHSKEQPRKQVKEQTRREPRRPKRTTPDFEDTFAEFEDAFQSYLRKGKLDPKYRHYEEFFVNAFNEWEEDEAEMTKKEQKRQILKAAVSISEKERQEGVTKKVQLQRREICYTCAGNSEFVVKKCTKCKGRGVASRKNCEVEQCPSCFGSGKIKKPTCSTCSGKKLIDKTFEELIVIKAGVHEGNKITLQGRGHQHFRTGHFGDLVLTVKIKPSVEFVRKGCDSYADLKVSIADAVLGCSLEYETLWGMRMLHLNPGTQNGKMIRIDGEGFRDKKNKGFGDHFLKVQVEIPTILGEKERQIFRELHALSL